MRLSFWKMHGAGNDFILVDKRLEQVAVPSPSSVARLCDRRLGIGADGLIMLQPSAVADVGVAFFNSDGSSAAMCGNGARCAARLVFELGFQKAHMLIETGAGIVRAEIVSDRVRVRMPRPSEWRPHQSLNLDGLSLACDFVNTGVPHVVISVPDVEAVDVLGQGSSIRYHSAFAPAGANVNFMEVAEFDSLRIRTYERGVEAETLACGTGATACALVAGRLGKVVPPVDVTCASGDNLEIDYRLTEDGAEDVSLLGPACRVFQGEIELD